MKKRTLGSTKIQVSDLCLGTMTFRWTSTEEESYEVMDRAFEAGINFFDTADVYTRWVPGNPGGVAEEIIGKWLKDRKIPRDKLILATKVRGKMWDGPDGEGLSRTHIMRAIDDSLRRLQTDYVDLYQSHSPDENTPQVETLRAFDMLIQQGKVRHIGFSNFKPPQIEEALSISKRSKIKHYETSQPRYSLVRRAEFEAEQQAMCANENIGVIPYSPLQGGLLTGKYKRGEPVPEKSRGVTSTIIQDLLKDERVWDLMDTLAEVSKERDETLSQTALAWVLTNPVISSAIIGASNVEQLNELIPASGKTLTPDEKAKLDAASAWS